ncbi:MAG TPA: OsmC family protein [Polyangiaceae bacterium]|nr:OsmC family protein [Polyangiaceae bacterium]
MSEHKAVIRWELSGTDFCKGQYSREHVWAFDGGFEVPASPSPAVVRAPYSNAAHVDPEEAFVASIASCHMLTFLHLASKEAIEVTAYEDEAVGVMTKNERRVPWVSAVTLRPRIRYGARTPDPAQESRLHELAHEQCFISNSVKTAIVVEPRKENDHA